jgi:HEAT repeat protein
LWGQAVHEAFDYDAATSSSPEQLHPSIVTAWPVPILVLLIGVWTLVAGLLAALVGAQLWRGRLEQRRIAARSDVRTALSTLAQTSRHTDEPDLEWWLVRAEALEVELTAALFDNPSVRGALEAVAAAAAREVVRLALPADAAAARPAGRTRRFDQAARLVALAPTRATRRALLALQAGDDARLGVLASAAMARHATGLVDTSAALACFVSLERDRARAMAGRWALRRVIDADRRRVLIHLHDAAPEVQAVALSSLDGRDVAGDAAHRGELATLALSRADDVDPHVRAAALGALTRVNAPIPRPTMERALADTDSAVRVAAAQALPLAGRDGLALLPEIDRTDPGLGRIVRRSLSARTAPSRDEALQGAPHLAWLQAASALPTPAAEDPAAQALSHAETSIRREAALALAALARLGATPRLQAATVEALLGRLESESAGPVSAAIVEALEATDDERAAGALSALAARAKPAWRLRLIEAAALAQRVRSAATAPRGSTASGSVTRPPR